MSNVGPLFRWAGSKRKLLPALEQYWNPAFKRYVEPFAGSACLFFHLQPPNAILGDLNQELISTYETVCRNPKRLAERLEKIPIGKESYYQLRANDTARSRYDAAARFIFLNRFCFNGLYRTNSAGRFNVPFGGARTGKLPCKRSLREVAGVLEHAQLVAGDFDKVLAKTRKGDFVYLDPPFAVENRRVFRQYGPQNFGLSDMERLALWLKRLDARGAGFVLSYAFCKEALDLFSEWPRRRVRVRRNIAGFCDSRRNATEIIFSNIPGSAA